MLINRHNFCAEHGTIDLPEFKMYVLFDSVIPLLKVYPLAVLKYLWNDKCASYSLPQYNNENLKFKYSLINWLNNLWNIQNEIVCTH